MLTHATIANVDPRTLSVVAGAEGIDHTIVPTFGYSSDYDAAGVESGAQLQTDADPATVNAFIRQVLRHTSEESAYVVRWKEDGEPVRQLLYADGSTTMLGGGQRGH